ncbi:ATP-binding protein [Nostoc sp. DedQUE09]|uniref:ATP-binding protein n=1 Tax=Nostoc sp. DedQUE09 TaxID=3075394 RepID=UPI002AD4F1FC|nr:ATP-binding protein [Nostoc sp. DedQUE09]MDZ7953291.1 ATP-binding protein [Nostoc sp. DedQUE09]
MSISASFPRSLLEKTQEDKLAYFLSYRAAHPHLIEATDRVIRTIQEPAGASFIFVYGPSGIGKTTMRLRVEQMLIKQALPTLETDRCHIPVVSVEAVGTESTQFNWKDYFTRSLISLEEPLIDYKVHYGSRGVRRNNQGEFTIDPKITSPELRLAFENALKYRRPKAFLIDEAQHMQKMASGRRLQDNLDCLKSLANLTGVQHVLFGTYELLMFRNLSAQLSRRTVDIHFPRYQAGISDDVEVFMSVLLTFQRHLPVEEEPDLLALWEYCYAGSLGCIGILKDWLTRALKVSLDEGAKTLTLKHLKQRAWSVAQLQTMLKEIQEGEKQLTEGAEKHKQLYQSLGLTEELPIELNNSLSNNANDLQEKVSKSPGRKKNVGKRNPKRDPVGGVEPNAS